MLGAVGEAAEGGALSGGGGCTAGVLGGGFSAHAKSNKERTSEPERSNMGRRVHGPWIDVMFHPREHGGMGYVSLASTRRVRNDSGRSRTR